MGDRVAPRTERQAFKNSGITFLLPVPHLSSRTHLTSQVVSSGSFFPANPALLDYALSTTVELRNLSQSKRKCLFGNPDLSRSPRRRFLEFFENPFELHTRCRPDGASWVNLHELSQGAPCNHESLLSVRIGSIDWPGDGGPDSRLGPRRTWPRGRRASLPRARRPWPQRACAWWTCARRTCAYRSPRRSSRAGSSSQRPAQLESSRAPCLV